VLTYGSVVLFLADLLDHNMWTFKRKRQRQSLPFKSFAKSNNLFRFFPNHGQNRINYFKSFDALERLQNIKKKTIRN